MDSPLHGSLLGPKSDVETPGGTGLGCGGSCCARGVVRRNVVWVWPTGVRLWGCAEECGFGVADRAAFVALCGEAGLGCGGSCSIRGLVRRNASLGGLACDRKDDFADVVARL